MTFKCLSFQLFIAIPFLVFKPLAKVFFPHEPVYKVPLFGIFKAGNLREYLVVVSIITYKIIVHTLCHSKIAGFEQVEKRPDMVGNIKLRLVVWDFFVKFDPIIPENTFFTISQS